MKTRQECFRLSTTEYLRTHARTRRSRKLGAWSGPRARAEVRSSAEEFGTFFETDLDSGLTA